MRNFESETETDLMDGKILITGATGNVGSEVLNALVERGQKVKAAVHTMEKVQNMEWDIGNVEIVPFDYRQPTTWENVFQNVDKMLLVAPPGEALSFQLVNPLINSAKDHGVEKIIYSVGMRHMKSLKNLSYRC